MEDQLISFETAKLAKEKGFIEQYQYKIVLGKSYFNAVSVDEGNEQWYVIGEQDIYKSNTWDDNWILAPTQALLQRWLREVHSIEIEIYPFTSQPVDEEVWPKAYQALVEYSAIHPYFKTYEEALDAALINALKLIK